MNRLWVRLSLAFAAVFIVAVLAIALSVRLTNAVLTEPLVPPPPEVEAYFARLRSEQPLPNVTTVMVVIAVVAISAGIWMSRRVTAPLAELEEHRAVERLFLETYQWIDSEADIARIPVDRAMEILVERGLPTREVHDE